jgi:nucleoside 2-deoxyribosyltransferase
MKVYVASSWRNKQQPLVVEELKKEGFEVYNFRNPEPGDTGFHWSDISEDWKSWTPEQFIIALNHPISELGYNKDMVALNEADIVILVMPCGRSSHLELGYAVGSGKWTAILLSDEQVEPEMMYRMASKVFVDVDNLVCWAKSL